MTATNVSQTLRQLLQAGSQAEVNNFNDWKNDFFSLIHSNSPSWYSALLGGFRSTCVGYTFASGYQAALHKLVPNLQTDKLYALCITEEQGNHPRAIETELTKTERGWNLSGAKKFITGGTQADQLLVAATIGKDPQNRPLLKLVDVPALATGVVINPMPQLPFVPEIEHASVNFESVAINASDILPGDGYDEYIKPFRTIEDLHVSLALCGYLLRIATRIQVSEKQLAQWMVVITSHVQLIEADPKDPLVHIQLAGVRQQLEDLITLLEPSWQQAEPTSFADWQRDKALQKVAGDARNKRTQTAWQTLRG